MAEELLRGRFADLESLEDELGAQAKATAPCCGGVQQRERRLLTLQWLVSETSSRPHEAIAAQQAELNAGGRRGPAARRRRSDEDVQHAEFESSAKKQRVWRSRTV